MMETAIKASNESLRLAILALEHVRAGNRAAADEIRNTLEGEERARFEHALDAWTTLEKLLALEHWRTRTRAAEAACGVHVARERGDHGEAELLIEQQRTAEAMLLGLQAAVEKLAADHGLSVHRMRAAASIEGFLPRTNAVPDEGFRSMILANADELLRAAGLKGGA